MNVSLFVLKTVSKQFATNEAGRSAAIYAIAFVTVFIILSGVALTRGQIINSKYQNIMGIFCLTATNC